MLTTFDNGRIILRRIGGLDVPDSRLSDVYVPMFHPADAAIPDGFWERSEVPLKHLQKSLEKGWEGELPVGRSLRPDVAVAAALPELPNLSRMTKAQLVEFAGESSLNLDPSRTKSELIGAIEAAFAE